MAMDGLQLADEIAAAMGYSPTSAQLQGFGKGIVEEVKNGTATFGTTPSGHTISGIVFSSMANLIKTYGGFPSVSAELLALCDGVSSNIMDNAIVTYIGPPPNPPIIEPEDAWFLGGTISGLDGSSMANDVKDAVGFPSVSTLLLAKCTAIVDHIMNNAEVVSGVIS